MRCCGCPAVFTTVEARDRHEMTCADALITIDALNNFYLRVHPLWVVAPDGMHHWAVEIEEGRWLSDCGMTLARPRLVFAHEEFGRRGPPTTTTRSVRDAVTAALTSAGCSAEMRKGGEM